MKTLLLADLHSEDPSNLIQVYSQREKIGRVGLLGDVDSPIVMRNILETTKKINLPLIHSIGNHDFCHVNGLEVFSPLMDEDLDYSQLWKFHQIQRQYVLDAIDGQIPDSGLIIPDPIDNRLVYAHASLVNMNVRETQVPSLLYTRLTLECDVEKEANFQEMQQKNFRLFFRGHDHNRALLVRDKNGKTKEYYFPYGKHKIDLENSFTIATIGAYRRGMHAIYDSETCELDFRGKGEE
jgi:hypothetical protein